jgi:hypothetical protein
MAHRILLDWSSVLLTFKLAFVDILSLPSPWSFLSLSWIHLQPRPSARLYSSFPYTRIKNFFQYYANYTCKIKIIFFSPICVIKKEEEIQKKIESDEWWLAFFYILQSFPSRDRRLTYICTYILWKKEISAYPCTLAYWYVGTYIHTCLSVL